MRSEARKFGKLSKKNLLLFNKEILSFSCLLYVDVDIIARIYKEVKIK